MNQGINLEGIWYCLNPDAKVTEEDHYVIKRFNLQVSTWMRLYETGEEPYYRLKLREAIVGIAEGFHKNKILISDHGTLAAKYTASLPYRYFLTTVNEIPHTLSQLNSLSFHELIDYTLGEIVDSLHITFMADTLWLTLQYMIAIQEPRMTVLCGSLLNWASEYDIPFDITGVLVDMPTEFGCHHAKVSIFKYKGNHVRIVIYTANLYMEDWQTRTQGLWVSPILPPLPESAEVTEGESPTNFKRDFIKYLDSYKEAETFGWAALMYRTDFSAVNVFFVGSVPGNHVGSELNSWGHRKLKTILEENAVLPPDAQNWAVVAQSSAVGVFGDSYESWLLSNIVFAMSQKKNSRMVEVPKFKFIFPSQKNYDPSFDCKMGTTCLMYNKITHEKQEWIKSYLYQWKSDKTGRSLAMPHSKCYTRISPDETEIPWFVTTSANLSKGAWGRMIRGGSCHSISNYEAGVVFIPSIIINQSSFPIKESLSPEIPVFPLPYDLPLIPYDSEDEPFLVMKKPDENTCKRQEVLITLEDHAKGPEVPEEVSELLYSLEPVPDKSSLDFIKETIPKDQRKKYKQKKGDGSDTDDSEDDDEVYNDGRSYDYGEYIYPDDVKKEKFDIDKIVKSDSDDYSDEDKNAMECSQSDGSDEKCKIDDIVDEDVEMKDVQEAQKSNVSNDVCIDEMIVTDLIDINAEIKEEQERLKSKKLLHSKEERNYEDDVD